MIVGVYLSVEREQREGPSYTKSERPGRQNEDGRIPLDNTLVTKGGKNNVFPRIFAICFRAEVITGLRSFCPIFQK